MLLSRKYQKIGTERYPHSQTIQIQKIIKKIIEHVVCLCLAVDWAQYFSYWWSIKWENQFYVLLDWASLMSLSYQLLSYHVFLHIKNHQFLIEADIKHFVLNDFQTFYWFIRFLLYTWSSNFYLFNRIINWFVNNMVNSKWAIIFFLFVIGYSNRFC